ncbi:hypothetical protein ACFV1L_15195 [Kitasatospora sp. NPDC059646]|uniref:hypothetical protein n=1 Tax=Kitasatospora sp. NPDC059646 TaxID=3346893 RepID=UPI00367C30B2
MSRLRRLATAVAFLPMLAAAACGGPSPAPAADAGTPSAVPSVGQVPVLDSANDRPLPLDSYLLTPAQEALVIGTQQRLLAQCAARFGLTYTMPDAVPRDSDAPTTRVDGRYGHQSARLMAVWGYHPEGGLRAGQNRWSAGVDTTLPGAAAAMTGSDGSGSKFGPGGQVVNGQVVPDHGCAGEAMKALTGSLGGRLGNAQIAEDLKLDTLRRSQDDPRTRAVFALWSACMKESGFDYPDPVAALTDPEWSRTPLPGEHELRVARADAECRHRHNVVGVWYAVDFAAQEQAVREHADALAAARAAVAAQVAAAQRVASG